MNDEDEVTEVEKSAKRAQEHAALIERKKIESAARAR